MNYYRECIKLTLEIGLAIYIIIFGHAVWNNFDQTSYQIAQTNENTREVQIYTEAKNIILHNVAKKENNTKLILKVDKLEFENITTTELTLNNARYNLKDLEYNENGKYYFFEMQNIIFDKHETLTYDYSIEIDDNKLLDYEFIIETI